MSILILAERACSGKLTHEIALFSSDTDDPQPDPASSSDRFARMRRGERGRVGLGLELEVLRRVLSGSRGRRAASASGLAKCKIR
jgi:hypothetical protein